MKKALYLLLATLIATTLGCAGHRNGTIELTENGGIKHYDNNATLISPPISTYEMAAARAKIDEGIGKRKFMEALSESLKGNVSANTAGTRKKYLGVIINEDTRRVAYVDHPEMSFQYRIPPKSKEFMTNNYEFIETSELHGSISVKFEGERYITHMRMVNKPTIYNGVSVAFIGKIRR